MRNLNNWLLSIIAITTILISFSSCTKESNDNVNANFENLNQIKEISIQGLNDTRDFEFQFEIKTNNERLLNAFGNESLTMEFLSEETIEFIYENEMISQNNQIDQQEEPENQSEWDGDALVQISMKGITSPHSLTQVPPYTLNISPQVNELIKELKATTVLDFPETVDYKNSNELSSKSNGFVQLWSNNKRVILNGDCGTKWTRTRNYWAETGKGFNPNQIINTTWFKCNTRIASCCSSLKKKSTNAWVRRVTVLNDVLASFTAWNHSCYGYNPAHYCVLNPRNTCSNYQPSGCWF